MFGALELFAWAWLQQAPPARPLETLSPPAAAQDTQGAAPAPPPIAQEGPQTGPISGYMELHFNGPTNGEPGILDFHRFVLLFSHRFSDRLRFVGELELEHAVVEGLEEAGELELEQAYLDFLVHPALNFRAGMMLVPVGIINERHEPPTFQGVERPFVDTVIVPTTWFDVGAGVHGAFGRGFRYRLYAMAPLDATEFTADEGLRGGAQKGVEAQVRNMAATGRLEYVGLRGLQTGISFWSGDTSFNVPRLDTTVGLYEFDARFSRGRFESRGQFAHVFINGAGELNDAEMRLTGVSPNVAEQLRGFYLEGTYHVLPSTWLHDAAVFARYENFDTQFKMPQGFVKLPEFDRDAWVVGATYWVDPDVAIKFDYSHVRNQSDVVPAPRRVNIGLGWWF
jgi:hypothetical protein